MGALFESASMNLAGAGRSSYEGTLTVADGLLTFRPAQVEPGAEAFTWRVPQLSDGREGVGLRVITLLGAVALQVGPLERLAMITLRGADRTAVDAVLADNGYRPVIGQLTTAAQELTSLRSWAVLFILIGLANSDTGLHAVTGFGMFAVGVWALISGPRVAILAANGLLLLALAAKNLQMGARSFWPVILGLLGLRQLSLWSEFRPLLIDPANRAWLEARLGAAPTEAAIVPAGYVARTVAFLLSTAAGAFAALMSIAVLRSGGQDIYALSFTVGALALTGWFLLVTALPERAARIARSCFPSTGPVAILVYPFVLCLCALMLLLRVLPPAPGK